VNSRLRMLAREIAAIHAELLAGGAPGGVICTGERASAGVAVVKLARAGAPPSALLKLTASPEGKRALARETASLIALHADSRLGVWRELLPRPCAHGTIQGHDYRIDSVLTGHAVTRPRAARASQLIREAAEKIAVLHEATATTVGGGPELAQRWVDAPLRELLHRAGARPGLTARLELVGEELHDALDRGTFPATWIHGDYWLGNLLFGPNPSLTGIVDWETAAPLELPLHDLLHLLLYSRRIATGGELGQMLCDQLSWPRWSHAERAVLEGQRAWHGRGGLTERQVLLLYWLRHAGIHARQQGTCVGLRYRLWERRNVLPVLASL
jgi:aminoglycoside phosphotransferase (APT) family kinase protein